MAPKEMLKGKMRLPNLESRADLEGVGRKQGIEEGKGDLADECPYPIVRVDSEGKVIYSNSAARPLLAAWHTQMGGHLTGTWKKRVSIAGRSRRERIYEIQASPYFFKIIMGPSSQKGIVNIFGIDITVEKTVEELLEEERARSTSAAKMAALGEMAAGVAHEINNPLAIIIGYAEQALDLLEAQRNTSENSLQRPLNRIISTSERIAKIVSALLHFSRDSGSNDRKPTPVADIIEKTVALCTQRFNAGEVELDVVPPSDEMKVYCLPTQISQILINLLSNAYDAAQEKEERWVKLYVESEEDSIRIVVEDSGNPSELLGNEKIFQPFYTTKEQGKGTGLGLSISHGIAEEHGGALYLDEKSRNTRFILSLPR